MQSSLFSALLGKLTLLVYKAILVTWLSIVVLSLVTTVIEKIVHKMVQSSLWSLHKSYSLPSHLVVYFGPVLSTFLLLKAA